MTAQHYRDGIQRAYEGELVGERVYARLSMQCSDPLRKAQFAAISEVEHRTQAALQPIAARLSIEPTAADIETRVGRRSAMLLQLSWHDFVHKAVIEWPPLITQFEAIRQLAPAGDAEAVAILVRHEVVLVEFVHAERAGRSPVPPLRLLQDFLAETARFGSGAHVSAETRGRVQ